MLIPFDGHPEVVVGISERSDGSMTWWNRVPVDEIVRENRDHFFVRQGIDPKRIVSGGSELRNPQYTKNLIQYKQHLIKGAVCKPEV